MKKILLFVILTIIKTISFGQVVIFQIQAPSTPTNLQGSYALTYDNEFYGTTWASPDITNPANSVTAALEFVDDGDTGTDPTYGYPNAEDACTPFGITAQPLAGKIAVLYRGDCQFGWKARHAQNAGAVAVIIINHSGAPVGMNGGDSGLVVTIPVIMVSTFTGILLESAIHAGTITQAFIGNKEGIFANDLGINKSEVLRSRRFSNLYALSNFGAPFSVQLGAWVRNHGNTSQLAATLTGNIDLEIGGTNIYNQSAVVPSLAPGDSAWVSLPTFFQTFYPIGYYDMSYTVTIGFTADEENSDNVLDVAFMISDSLYSYSRLDPVTFEPLSPAQTNGGNSTGFEACMAFQDPDAWRVTYRGMNFTGLSIAPNLMTNEYVEVRVYQWDDVFIDNNDVALDFANLVTLDAAFFVYQDETLQDVNVFVPLDGNLWNGQMYDNQRYLFCVNSISTTLLIGFDNSVDYTLAQDSTNGHHQPSFPSSVDQVWYLNGFGLDFPIAASAQFGSWVGLDELNNELNIVSYPNPAIDVLNIPVGDRNGSATFELYDVAGKLVISQVVTFGNNETLTIDVSLLNSGSYVAKMIFESAIAKFNVVVSK